MYGRSCLKKQQLRKLLTDLFFSFALACACSISRCDCKDIQGELLDTVQGGKRRMLTTQSYFTDSCFCCLVFLYFAVLALLAFELVDSLSWELLFAYSVLRIPWIYLTTVSHTLPVMTTKMFEALPNIPWERQDHPWWNVISLGSLLSCSR